jgi:hypothetical protein
MAFFFMEGIVVVTAVWYYGAISSSTPDRRSHWIQMALILAVALAAAVGLGAVQLLPSSEYGRVSLRFIDGGTFPASEKIPYQRLVPGVWPQSIVSALLPTGFNGKFGGEEYFPFYVGVFPFFLAMTAIWKCRDNLWVRYLAGMAVLAFLYALGEFSPLHGVLYAVVPFLWLARDSDRFFFLISFSLTILAAFGLDALLDPDNRGISWTPARRILKWIAISTAATLFVAGVFPQLNLSIWTSLSLLLILGACGWFVYLTVNPAARGTRVMLVAFILFDLAAFSWQETGKISLSKTGDQLQQMVSLRGAAEFVKARPGLHRVRVSVQPEPNIGDVYGVEAGWGGWPTTLTEYSQLGFHDNLLNVGYYIKPSSVPDPGSVYQDASWKVYQNPNAYPRAWIVHQAVLEASSDAAFHRLDAPGTNLHQVAVLETPLPRPLDAAGGTGDSVRFRSYEPERMAMDVNTGTASLLVLSEMFYPGWVAQVNGKTAKIYRVDGALRGIAVPAGSNRIELEYTPWSFRVGAALSLLTLACVLAGWIRITFYGDADAKTPDPQ